MERRLEACNSGVLFFTTRTPAVTDVFDSGRNE